MTLYAFRLKPDSTSLENAEVVDESRYGWEFLEQAIALWRARFLAWISRRSAPSSARPTLSVR